jgi:hypothetical protein
VFFAWLFLGQLPTLMQFVGGVLIIAGVALVRIDELRSPADDLGIPAGLDPVSGDAAPDNRRG